MSSILVYVVCLALGLKGLDAMATVTFQLTGYDDKGLDKLDDGTKCEPSAFLPCDPFFEICFNPTGGSDCEPVQSFIYDASSSISAERFSTLPALVYTVNSLTTYRLTVRIRDMDTPDRFSLHRSQFMGRVDATGPVIPGTTEITSDTSNGFHTLMYQITARCHEFFFGTDCAKRCEEQDNSSSGYFTCDDAGDPVCLAGFQDPSTPSPCITPLDSCASTPCVNAGSCTDAGGGNFDCDCTGTGFMGVTCDTDLNECMVFSPCVNGAQCENTEGSYFCTCMPGFVGTRCEITETLCAGLCQNGATCPCDNGATCHQGNPGETLCACLPGYTGGRCESLINVCSPNPCRNGATCIQNPNMPAQFSCPCLPGFNGPLCEGFESPCDAPNNPCRNGATCTSSGPGNFNCACTTGYSGVTCEVDEDACASGPCRNGGTCTDTLNGFVCCCKMGHTGDACDGVRIMVDLKEIQHYFRYLSISKLRFFVMRRCPGIKFTSFTKILIESEKDKNCFFDIFYGTRSGVYRSDGRNTTTSGTD